MQRGTAGQCGHTCFPRLWQFTPSFTDLCQTNCNGSFCLLDSVLLTECNSIAIFSQCFIVKCSADFPSIQLLLASEIHMDNEGLPLFSVSLCGSCAASFSLWSKEIIPLNKPSPLIPSFAVIIIASSDCAAVAPPPSLAPQLPLFLCCKRHTLQSATGH